MKDPAVEDGRQRMSRNFAACGRGFEDASLQATLASLVEMR